MLQALFVVIPMCIFYYSVVYQLLPETLLRIWFTFNTIVAVTLTWFLARILRALSSPALGILSANKCEIYVRYVCALILGRFHRACNRHIRLHTMPGSLSWSEIHGHYVICMNHTSFFDTLLFLWKAPFPVMKQIRAFAKATLLNIPLFGFILESCKHFLVYFKDDNSSSFSVNKEKQALVSQEVEKFICNGGCLSFFPEGAMNRNPPTLQDFRLGTMTTILKHKLDIYYCVVVNNHIVWPPSLKTLPGYSADLYLYLGKFEYNPETEDASSLATKLRNEMQCKLNAILAKQNEQATL